MKTFGKASILLSFLAASASARSDTCPSLGVIPRNQEWLEALGGGVGGVGMTDPRVDVKGNISEGRDDKYFGATKRCGITDVCDYTTTKLLSDQVEEDLNIETSPLEHTTQSLLWKTTSMLIAELKKKAADYASSDDAINNKFMKFLLGENDNTYYVFSVLAASFIISWIMKLIIDVYDEMSARSKTAKKGNQVRNSIFKLFKARTLIFLVTVLTVSSSAAIVQEPSQEGSIDQVTMEEDSSVLYARRADSDQRLVGKKSGVEEGGLSTTKNPRMEAALESLLQVGGMFDEQTSSTSSISRQLLQPGDSYIQQGNDILGNITFGSFGRTVDVSGDGSVVAVGMLNSGSGTDRGRVRVYTYDGTDYIERAGITSSNDLVGSADNDRFGLSLSLSYDGKYLAVGAPGYGAGKNGYARVFEWNDESGYIQRGNDLIGEADGDQFGWSVSLISNDAPVLAVGAIGNGNGAGYVRVFHWTGSEYLQRGSDLDGDAAGDNFGHDVGLSSDGSILAVGAPGNAGGVVKVFAYDGTAYVLVNLLWGPIDGEQLGYALDISPTGDVLAAYSHPNHVKVFESSDGISYIQRGPALSRNPSEGEYGDGFGLDFVLSSDGSVLAVGAYESDGISGEDSGRIAVFAYDGTEYIQHSDFEGDGAYHNFGVSVGMSSDGSIIAGGSVWGDSAEGYVRVFELDATPPAPQDTGAWDIILQDFSTNFSASSIEEITLTYDIGRAQQYESFLLQGDCNSTVTDIVINTTKTVTSKNLEFDTLTLSYSVDKSMVGSSVIWDADSDQINLCQVVQLIADGFGVVTSVETPLFIDFGLTVNYEIVEDVTLVAATDQNATDNAGVASYISACKCDGIGFNCNSDALVQNTDLAICIKSTSPDVQIENLESMTITQDGANDLPIVVSGEVPYPQSTFAGLEYVPNMNGVVVSTIVPVNLFDNGLSISVGGSIEMRLTDSGEGIRKLRAEKPEDAKDVSFSVEVNLQREMMFEEEVTVDSAASVASNGMNGVVAATVSVLVWTYAVVW